ncbi:hypothetical protein BXO88_01055 [Oribacterium sp. C9]|nr:hypothetical protein BXO88_01055 [Oribacterium sp. C9]
MNVVNTDNKNLATRISEEEDHYIFEIEDGVTREKVYYKNRFGIEIAADLYKPADFDENSSYSAIVVGPPFGGVKEQGPGVYANQLAKRGFVAVAFDPSFHGYSGGEVRYSGSSSTYVEDFSAGVDYLGTLSYVDREKIGAIGICGSGGFAISAASLDPRIKAVATSALYDIAGNMNALPTEARNQMLSQAADMRWARVDGSTETWLKSYPDEPAEEIPDGLDANSAEFFEFYGTSRGWHENALGNVTMESMMDLMTLPTTGHVSEIVQPVLMITGDIAHSKSFTDDIYNQLTGNNKELIVVEGARHIDLYDDVEKIPFDDIARFFNNAFDGE